jgi:putative tryptophan/tyrosine transport system substrate-binding protein
VDDVNDPKAYPQRREIEAAGKELEIKIMPAEVRTASDIGSAYDALAAGGVEVVVVEQSNMLIVSRKQIADAAAAKKLPTVYGYREHVEAGGLISYGVNLNSCFHRAIAEGPSLTPKHTPHARRLMGRTQVLPVTYG